MGIDELWDPYKEREEEERQEELETLFGRGEWPSADGPVKVASMTYGHLSNVWNLLDQAGEDHPLYMFMTLIDEEMEQR